MARRARVRYLCTFCEVRISEGVAFCNSCGHPTSWATHDEKVAWELKEYEQKKSQLTELIPPVEVTVIPRQYTRRAASQSSKRTEEKTARPKSSQSKPVARRAAAKPVRLPVKTQVELPEADDKALLFKIVRVLNERITELESRLAELEGSESQVI